MNLQVKRVIVKYNEKNVGFLEELSNGKIAFQYDEGWLKEGFSISPMTLPLRDTIFIAKNKHFDGLFGVFQDALPDGWGELLMRRFLSKKGINFDRLSPLTKLSLVQDNGLGALSFYPNQTTQSKQNNVDLDDLSEEISRIINGDYTHESLDAIYALGGSSGGTRPKAHIHINDDAWIVKFPSSLDAKECGLLEYNANQLAKKSNIRVNTFSLFPSTKGSGYFGAKRFDRDKQRRIHMISLSSLLETTHRTPNLDYSHLFQVVQKICIDKNEMYEAYRRMCFNVLFQNKDDHGKNMAFLYDKSLKGYTLSPFYDITKTPNKVEHEMTVLGQGNPNEETLLSIASAFNLSMKQCKEIIHHIKETISK